jgi:hypothetical protein
VVDPESRRAEVSPAEALHMVLVASDPGRLRSLRVGLEIVDGPKLRPTWDAGAAKV